ncbi:putative reverse transcriptase domain-containing protein, partial [Tanacetum coccineum]
VPRNVNPINSINLTARACYECGSTDHFQATCPRLNQAQRQARNHQNQVVAVNGGQGRGNNGNQARGRAFMLGSEEARQDPNIMTCIEASDLGFSYEIEIASGQLVEIDKVIKGCKLEIEGHEFDINLIPFGSGSFDVIIGMD